MFSKNRQNVKSPEECDRANPHRFGSEPWKWMLWEIDCHPRLGWFWVALLAANTLLNLLDLLGFGGS